MQPSFADLNFDSYVDNFSHMAYLIAKRRGFYGQGYDRTAAVVDLSDEVTEFFCALPADQGSELADVVITAFSLYWWLKSTGKWVGPSLGAAIIDKMRYNAQRTDPAKVEPMNLAFADLLRLFEPPAAPAEGITHAEPVGHNSVS